MEKSYLSSFSSEKHSKVSAHADHMQKTPKLLLLLLCVLAENPLSEGYLRPGNRRHRSCHLLQVLCMDAMKYNLSGTSATTTTRTKPHSIRRIINHAQHISSDAKTNDSENC